MARRDLYTAVMMMRVMMRVVRGRRGNLGLGVVMGIVVERFLEGEG